MLTRIAESAVKGDTKSAAFLLQRYDMMETGQEHANSAPTPEEQEIIDKYVARSALPRKRVRSMARSGGSQHRRKRSAIGA
jgi:hypothetical protein